MTDHISTPESNRAERAVPVYIVGSEIGLGGGVSSGVAMPPGNYRGQTSIDTVGRITTGEWRATPIAIEYGGTGADNAADALRNLGGIGAIAPTAGAGESLIGARNGSSLTLKRILGTAPIAVTSSPTTVSIALAPAFLDRISSIEQVNSAQNQAIANTQAAIAATQQAIEALEAQIAAQTSAAEIEAIEAQIILLEAANAELEAQIQALQAQNAQHSDELAVLAIAQDSQGEQITDLYQQSSANLAAIGNLSGRANNTDAQLASLQATTSGLDSRLDAIEAVGSGGAIDPDLALLAVPSQEFGRSLLNYGDLIEAQMALGIPEALTRFTLAVDLQNPSPILSVRFSYTFPETGAKATGVFANKHVGNPFSPNGSVGAGNTTGGNWTDINSSGDDVMSNGWKAVWLMRDRFNGAIDVCITDGRNPNFTGSYMLVGKLGYLKLDSDGNIIPFVQNGDRFEWVSLPDSFSDFSGTLSTSIGNLITLNAPPKTQAFGSMFVLPPSNLTGGGLYYSSTDVAERQQVLYLANTWVSTDFDLRTNSNSQIRCFVQNDGVYGLIQTHGFIYHRSFN